MKNLNKLIKSNDGAALIVVIVAFLVIIILSASILFLMNTNLRQARHQEHIIEAYYLAYSGIEMGYAALIANGDELLTDFIVEYNNNYSYIKEENSIIFGEGKINILISGYEEKDNLWISIKSTGILNQSGISTSMSMSFLADNKSIRKWEK